MKLNKLRTVAFAMILPALFGCGGSTPDQDTEAPPPAAVEQDQEAVFEEDFEAGEAAEWAETQATDAAASEDSETDPDQE